MLIDTHAHLNFKAFNKDWPEVVKKSVALGVTKIINVGAKLDTSRTAVEMAQKDKHLFATVGFHPTHIDEYTESVIPELKQLARKTQVVAIGETGLDLKEQPDTLAQQERVFNRCIDMSQETGKPLIVHIRDAYDRALQILQTYQEEEYKGVIHCYCGDLKRAQQFIDLGFLISFTGIITFSDDQKLLNTVKELPLEKIMVETDCPYLAPASKRGERCEPGDVKEIADKIAELKGIKPKEVYEATTKNAEELFGI